MAGLQSDYRTVGVPVQFDSVITGFQVAISKYLSSGVNKTFGTGGFETFLLFLKILRSLFLVMIN